MIKQIVICATLLGVILLGVFYKIQQIPLKPVHYHANLAVFEGGREVDFSKPEFMHISPCVEGEEHSNDPEENVHLHDGVGNVVHVHASNISWKTFFESIDTWTRLEKAEKMAQLAENFAFNIQLNGKSVPLDQLTSVIEPKSKLLIVIGTASADLKKENLAVGDTAGDYDDGKKGIEQCGTTGERSFWDRFNIAFGLL